MDLSHSTNVSQNDSKNTENLSDAEKHFQSGEKLAAEKKYEESIVEYTKAIELDPTNANYYHARGIILERNLGRLDEGLKDYQKSIELDPKNALYENNIASVMNEMLDSIGAITHATRCLEIDPTFPFAHGNLALAHMHLGQLKEAEMYASKALEIPQASKALYVMGRVMDQTQQYEEALRCFQKFVEIGHPRQVLIDRANGYITKIKKRLEKEKERKAKETAVPEMRYNLFLSHYQHTGGLLAMVLKLLMEQYDPSLKLFLDVDDLESLHNLKDNVLSSENVALLLTEGVFQRRFVIEEITTALQAKKNIILIWDKQRCQWPDPKEVPEHIRDVLNIRAIIWNPERDFRSVVVQQIHSKLQKSAVITAQESNNKQQPAHSIESLYQDVQTLKADNEQLKNSMKNLTSLVEQQSELLKQLVSKST